MTRIAHTTPPVYPDGIPATKFASRIERENPEGCAVALLGIPDDTGISLNNGIPGAKAGPDALRAALATMGVAEPHGWAWPGVFDAGDVEIAGDDLHATHDRVTDATSAILELGLLPIAIGGGHDLTYPFVRAAARHHGVMHGIYLDPHLDVRETDGSGMPFRKILETGAASSLRIHGFDPMSNTSAHTDWFLSHGGRIDDLTQPTTLVRGPDLPLARSGCPSTRHTRRASAPGTRWGGPPNAPRRGPAPPARSRASSASTSWSSPRRATSTTARPGSPPDAADLSPRLRRSHA